MLVLDDTSLKEDRLGVIVLHKFLHLGWQIFKRVTADGMHAHSVGELAKVRVDHGGVRVSLFVEQVCSSRAREHATRSIGLC